MTKNLVSNFCPLSGYFSSKDTWFQRGHVTVTRHDWMLM